MFSVVDTGTFLSGFIPGFLTGQVARPKRPGSALGWSDWVNHTFFLVLNFSQKIAIFTARLFNDCCSQSDSL